jgi:uncharacterized membrane protein YphA (DoxX/SURF4 family)
MISSWYHPYAIIMFRLALSALFIMSSIPKIKDKAYFTGVVSNYRILPSVVAKLFGVIFPYLELLIGLLLLLGLFTNEVLLISYLCILVFTVAMLINLLRGRKQIDCGCFGPKLSQKIGPIGILRNIILIMIVNYCYIYNDYRLSVDWFIYKHKGSWFSFHDAVNIFIITSIILVCLLLLFSARSIHKLKAQPPHRY